MRNIRDRPGTGGRTTTSSADERGRPSTPAAQDQGLMDELAVAPNVVVVPFFIADGLHSYQDIPMMLGFEKEEGLAASQKEIFRHNPYYIRKKTLYYSSAIGVEPMMADVILDLVTSFDSAHLS